MHTKDAQPPDRLVSAIYHCRLCSAEAGYLQLKIYDGRDEATFVLRGLMGETTRWVSRQDLAQLVRVLTIGTAGELYALDMEWASFYCPECDAMYCKAHWRTRIQFDDAGDMPGWYDCTYGICPQGHERIVDD